MSTTQISTNDGVATLILARDKVNAINETLIDDINNELDNLEADTDIDGIILTGREKFFSFGFDVPELLSLSEEGLRRFLTKHTALLLRLFTFSKPVIAAVNGHATAGGCMLIMACDFRVAGESRAKIGLNEIDLGVSVFGGSAEMLRYWVGNRCAETILNQGKLYSVVQAANLGMIDVIVQPDRLMSAATDKAREFGGKPKAAYRAIKKLMRGRLAASIRKGEQKALDAFIETWHSPDAQKILSTLKIRG